MSTITGEDLLPDYIEAMLWASACCAVEDCADGRDRGDCEHTDHADQDWDHSDLAPGDRDTVITELGGFLNLVKDTGWQERMTLLQFAHDFALTRNGHGAGFWDRGLGELGDALTKWAKTFGSAYIYVTEEGISL